MRTIIIDTADERVETDSDTGNEYHYRKDYLNYGSTKPDVYSMPLSYISCIHAKLPAKLPPTPDTVSDCTRSACTGHGLPLPKDITP